MIAMKTSLPPLPQIVVLAAGFSTRLGRPKALARIHGRTLLQRTAAALAPVRGCKVHVVIPARSCLRRLARFAGWTCVENPGRARGLASSVARGIAHCRCAPAILFLPVDLPNLRTRDIKLLLQRWRGNRRRIVARGIDGRAVIPLILPRRLFGMSAALHGDTGLKELIGSLAPDDLRLVRMNSAACDIDTPAELRAARRRFHGGTLRRATAGFNAELSGSST